MSKCIDLTDLKFGKLTVKYRADNKIVGKRKKIAWVCDCDCGNKDIISLTEDLRSGHKTSCGCRQKETQFLRIYNTYDLSGDYAIGYTSKGEEFYFDLDDYNKVKFFTWYTDRDGYIKCSERIKFHRLVTGCDSLHDIDHINHNQSDNRKVNLRITTTQQNCSNREKNKNNTTGFTGIYFRKKLNKWVAMIGYENKLIYLGLYKTKDEAIKTRDIAEEKYYGEYSYNNSMKKSEEY